jgi:hypothetical protein
VAGPGEDIGPATEAVGGIGATAGPAGRPETAEPGGDAADPGASATGPGAGAAAPAGEAIEPGRATARSRFLSSIPPMAVSVSRRTRTSLGARRSEMPPGAYVCSSGTRRTARGSARGGSASGGQPPPPASRGVHQRGGATIEATAFGRMKVPGPARLRRTGTGRAVAAANRVARAASDPIVASRRPPGGPGRRSRCWTAGPSGAAALSSSGAVLMSPPVSST